MSGAEVRGCDICGREVYTILGNDHLCRGHYQHRVTRVAYAETLDAEDPKDLLAKIAALTADRDALAALLARWTLAVEKDSSWDGWDEHFKDAAYRPGPLREIIDKARIDAAGGR